MKVRKSNIELLRVVSMFLIVLHHFSLYLKTTQLPGVYPLKLSIQVMSIGGKIGANCFFIIMSYFLIKKSASLKSILPLWKKTFFYSNMIFLLLWFTNQINVNSTVFFRSVFPILFNGYWFITLYVILIIFAPYLNTLLNAFSKQEYQRFLVWCFLILSVITMLVGYINVNVMTNNYVLWGIFLYATGGYLRRYQPQINWSMKQSVIGLALILIADVAMIVLFDLLAVNWPFFEGKELLLANRSQSFFAYLAAVLLFVIFEKIDMPSSRLINACAGSMITVYLIHDHFLFRSVLWGFISQFQNSYALGMIGLALISSLLIMMIGVALDQFNSLLVRKMQAFYHVLLGFVSKGEA